MKWFRLWVLLWTPSVFAEDFGCFYGWSDCELSCPIPMQSIVPIDNTRVVVKVPAGTRVDLWGNPQPLLKGEIGSYKFYLNPCLASATKDITVSVPVDGRTETMTDRVVLYPGQENVFGYFWDDYSQRLLRFQNHDSRLLLIMKVPENALIYLNGDKRRNLGTVRTFFTREPEGTVLEKSLVTVTLQVDGKLLKWEESLDFKVQIDPYRLTIVYDASLGELIRREPLRRKQTEPTPAPVPHIVKPRSKT